MLWAVCRLYFSRFWGRLLKFRQNSNITCTSFMLKSTTGLQSLFAPTGHPIDGFAREKAGWIPLKWRVHGYDIKVGIFQRHFVIFSKNHRERDGVFLQQFSSVVPQSKWKFKKCVRVAFLFTWLSRIVKPPSQLSNVWFFRAASDNFPEQSPFSYLTQLLLSIFICMKSSATP